MNRTTPKTDSGTIILHWVLVIALIASVTTGLRFAADSVDYAWLKAIDPLLPQSFVWTTHVIAGLALFAVAVSYSVYVARAGLTQRIRLDSASLSALVRGGQGRKRTVNIALHWLMFVALLSQLVTGVLLYFGHGGTVVEIHRAATWAVIAYPLAHIAAHAWFGGVKQLLRIFRPAKLVPPSSPFDPADLWETWAKNPPVERRSGADRRGNATKPGTPTLAHNSPGVVLSAHPIAVAGAVGLAAAATAFFANETTHDTLEIARIEKTQAPKLDGDLSDPIWRSSRPLVVHTHQGANFDSKGESTVEIRAVHDGETAYFAFTWTDPTRSLKHLPLIRKADGWHLLHEQYDIEDEDAYYEDKFAVMMSNGSGLAGNNSIHLGQAPLKGMPAAFSGRGLHYTTDGSIVDVWHWKATRGGLLGYVDDNYFGPPSKPKQAEIEGQSRYKAGYEGDPGRAFYSNNFKQRPPGGYKTPIQPSRLPKDLAATIATMGRIDLDPKHGEDEGARWWMTEEESVPYSAERDAKIPVGTVIPGVIIAGAYSGDRADVRCAARWAAGRWTLEVTRRLDTNSQYDIPITSQTFMWVASFDHSQTRHTRHLRPIRMEVK